VITILLYFSKPSSVLNDRDGDNNTVYCYDIVTALYCIIVQSAYKYQIIFPGNNNSIT